MAKSIAQGRIISAGSRLTITGGGRVKSIPSVLYEYEVNGQKYSSNRLMSMSMSVAGNVKLVEKYVSRYRVGETITVYYDPNNPSDAVLEPGLAGTFRVMMGIGGGVGCLIGIGISIVMFLIILRVFFEYGILFGN